MHKPKFVLENKTHRILWYFQLEADQQITVRRSDLVLTKKRKKSCHLVNFAVPPSEQEKKRNDKQIFGPFQKAEEAVKHEGDDDIDRSWGTWNGP